MARKKEKPENKEMKEENVEDEQEPEQLDNQSIFGSGEEYSYSLRIPGDRVAALIGVKGQERA